MTIQYVSNFIIFKMNFQKYFSSGKKTKKINEK